MRRPYEPQQPQEPHELAEPREARSSGAIRIASDAEVPQADGHTLRSGLRLARPNGSVPLVPSILVDASYLQAVSSVVKRRRARRTILTLAAACAFVCGTLASPLALELVGERAAPAAATSRVKNVPTSLQTRPIPSSAAPLAEPPRRTRINQREAARRVHHAQELQQEGRMLDARRVLTDVLKDRPGYPPGLAAMAELELERDEAASAAHWARLAVRALPRSIENWQLLDRACTRAGLEAESARAHERATELYLLKR